MATEQIYRPNKKQRYAPPQGEKKNQSIKSGDRIKLHRINAFRRSPPRPKFLTFPAIMAHFCGSLPPNGSRTAVQRVRVGWRRTLIFFALSARKATEIHFFSFAKSCRYKLRPKSHFFAFFSFFPYFQPEFS